MLSSPPFRRSARVASSSPAFSSLPPTVKRPRVRSPAVPTTHKRSHAAPVHPLNISVSDPFLTRSLHFSVSAILDSSAAASTGQNSNPNSNLNLPNRKRSRPATSANSTSTLSLPVSESRPARRSRVPPAPIGRPRFPDPPPAHTFTLPVDGLETSLKGHRRRSFSPVSSLSLRSACLRGSNSRIEILGKPANEYSLAANFSTADLNRLNERIIGRMASGHAELDRLFDDHLSSEGWIREATPESKKRKNRQQIEKELREIMQTVK